MSLQIEHIPSVYYNSSATIGSLFLFNDYMNEPNIRSNKLYIECKIHVKKMFPHVDENDMGIHVAIIGMMALKEGPFYNSNKTFLVKKHCLRRMVKKYLIIGVKMKLCSMDLNRLRKVHSVRKEII